MKKRKTCELCDTRACYGLPGGKARWCKSHKADGAVDVINKTCEKCNRHPTFGVPGTKQRRWCLMHRPEGAVDVGNKKCEECNRQPSFGLPGKKPRWCAAHRPEGAVDDRNNKCEECDTRANFGLPGERAKWCFEHRPEGAVDVVSKRCEECNTHASFGMPGQKAKWCLRHRPEGAVDVVGKKCAFPECDVRVHAHEYCASHDTDRKRKTRVRENQVANFLRDQGLHWTAWNRQLAETACGRYRPDFVYELPSHVVLVEVDEHQHAQPGYACDNARMLDIFGAYGGTPVVFLRFNPDAFKLGGVTKRVTLPTRLRRLETQLRAALDCVPPRQLTIVRLFYDDPQSTVSVSWVAPDDPSFVETPL